MNQITKPHKSNWKQIIIIQEIPIAYDLDKNGRLITKFPKLKLRKGLFRQDNKKRKLDASKSGNTTNLNATNMPVIKVDNVSPSKSSDGQESLCCDEITLNKDDAFNDEKDSDSFFNLDLDTQDSDDLFYFNL